MHALLLNLFYSNFYVIYRFSNMFMDYQWKKKLKTFLRDVAGTLKIETLRHTQWFQCTCSIYLSQYLVHPLSLIITCSTIQRILTRTREALSRGIEFLQMFNSMKIKEHYWDHCILYVEGILSFVNDSYTEPNGTTPRHK